MCKKCVNVTAVVVNPCKLNFYGSEVDAYIMCIKQHVLLVRKITDPGKSIQAMASSAIVRYSEEGPCSVEVDDVVYEFKKNSIVLFNKKLPLFTITEDNQSVATLTTKLYETAEVCGLKDMCRLLNGYYDFKDSRKTRSVLAKCFTDANTVM